MVACLGHSQPHIPPMGGGIGIQVGAAVAGRRLLVACALCVSTQILMVHVLWAEHDAKHPRTSNGYVKWDIVCRVVGLIQIESVISVVNY